MDTQYIHTSNHVFLSLIIARIDEVSALSYLQTIQFQSFKVKLAAQSERLHSEDQPRQEGCAFDKIFSKQAEKSKKRG
jgi:hypothetical protein